MTEDNYFLDVEVRALTIRLPYASLMLPPHHKVETRSWLTHYRGWVLICAAKTVTSSWVMAEISGDHQASRIIEAVPIDSESLHKLAGMAIGIGQLVDCRQMTEQDADAAYVQYKPGYWCHVFRDVKPIHPFPYSGQLGYTELQDPTKRKILIKF